MKYLILFLSSVIGFSASAPTNYFKLTELNSAAALATNNLFYVVQTNLTPASRQATGTQLLTFAATNLTLDSLQGTLSVSKLNLAFGDGLTNSAGTLKVSLEAGSNITFTTNNGKITIASSGGGGGGITSINSQTGASQTIVAGTSGTDFAVSSSGDTHTLNLPTANGSNRGALSSADWTTFQAKQPTITGAATTITNSDLTASRAVVSDGSGKITVSTTTSTEIGYVNGVTAPIQTQLNSKQNGDAALTNLSSLNVGIVVSTSSDNFTTRTNIAGSSKISIADPAGIAGNPTFDVVEGNLTLNNIGGILATNKGGTGLSTHGTANQVLGVNTSANGLEYKTITAGSGITVTPTAGALTIAATGGSSWSARANNIFPSEFGTSIATTTAATANAINVCLAYWPMTRTVTNVISVIQTADAAGSYSFGIYTVDGATRVLYTGVQSTAATGNNVVTLGTPVSITEGWYYVAFTSNSSSVIFNRYTLMTGGAALNAGAFVVVGNDSQTTAGAALPTSLATLSASTANDDVPKFTIFQ